MNLSHFKKFIVGSILLLNLPFALAEEMPVVHFATEATYVPFVTLKPDGTVDGFETAIVKAVCEEAHWQCDFKHLPFDSLLPSLLYKKIDAMYGGVEASEERKKQILFTKAIFNKNWGLVAPQGKSVEMTKASLTGKTIGVQQGTTFETYLQKEFGNVLKIKSYASIQDALLDLKTGRVEVVFGDAPVLKVLLKNTHENSLHLTELPNPPGQTSEGISVGFRKEDKALVEQFNAAFDKVKAKGIDQKIEQQYLE